MGILTFKNNKWKHFKDADGNTYSKITVNGYEYGDRLLEDVLFNIEIDNDGYLSIQVQDSDKDYFSELNEEHWYKLIIESIINDRQACNLIKNSYDDVQLVELQDENEFENYFDNEEDTQPSIVANLNNVIQTMNNGKTNITANPVLNDLGIDGNDSDSEFEEYNLKLENFKNSIQEQLTEKDSELKTLNHIIDRDKYWEVFYTVETYTSLINKFFDKEYLTHPKDRLKKIQTFLEEITYKFNSYLVSISYKIKTEEDIEAYEKEHIAKTLLTEHFSVKKSQKVEEKDKIDFAKEGLNITDEKKSKLSDLLRKMEASESLEKEKESGAIKELSEYDKADLKGKIAIKYKEVHARAIELDGEEDGLIKTYVETLYNPETTSLDDKNLLLNLLIVSKMQDISIMKWDFDEKRVKVSNTEIDLKHNWWSKILTEDIEQDLKYVKIVEKDLNLAFYTSLFSDLLKKADKLSYGERNLKFKKLLADGDEDLSRGGLLLDTLLKKTQDGSVLFITPDMEKHVQTETIINDELGDKGQIRYIGTWKQRHVFVINVEKIRGLEKYSNEIIYLNAGNSYVLNPEKPIVYFNVIENPFLERPIIKWYAGAEFDISMDKASRMRIDNNFLE